MEHFIISSLCILHLRREGSIGRGGAFHKIILIIYSFFLHSSFFFVLSFF